MSTPLPLQFETTISGEFHLRCDGSATGEAIAVVHAAFEWTTNDRSEPAAAVLNLRITIDDRELIEHHRFFDRRASRTLLGERGLRAIEQEACMRLSDRESLRQVDAERRQRKMETLRELLGERMAANEDVGASRSRKA